MKTQARHRGLWGFLLVALGVTWLMWGMAPLEALSAWGARFASWGSCMFMGLYSVAPAFQGAAPHMTGKLFCTAILGLVMLLMGTTLGGMGAYLLVRTLVRVRWMSLVRWVVGAVSAGAATTQVQQAK